VEIGGSNPVPFQLGVSVLPNDTKHKRSVDNEVASVEAKRTAKAKRAPNYFINCISFAMQFSNSYFSLCNYSKQYYMKLK